MSDFVGVILVALALLAVLAVVAMLRGQPRYELKKAIFSPAERSFLGVLDQACGLQFRILGLVRVADVLEVRGGARKEWLRAHNKIRSKHFDFLLCTPDTLAPVCAIELDDKTHRRADRRARDQFLDSVCTVASLPLVHIRAARSYQVDAVRCQIEAAIAETNERDAARSQPV
jgi:hypothetical protein